MRDKYGLIANGLIPLSKYWSIRLGFLDIINNTKLFVPLIENRKDVGDDLKVLIKTSKEWKNKNEHYVGEAGALFRLLQFASWKLNLGKKFIKDKTLIDRKICDNPDIINWPINKLLELDNETPQWASAAILTGSQEDAPDNFFLNLSKEALHHYNKVKNDNIFCELRYDETIQSQAEAFIDLLKNGQTDFKPKQQDDYCFARAFNLIHKEEGGERWPELKGHESNRLVEMEKQLNNFDNKKEVDSKDHRVVYSIAMLAMAKNKKINFSFPDCVNKSWPQFWKFLKYADKNKDTKLL
jgi:hypothetical protein